MDKPLSSIYCPNCGQQLHAKVKFCWNCGTDVHGIISTSNTDPANTPARSPRAEEHTKTFNIAEESQHPDNIVARSNTRMAEDALPACPRCGRIDDARKITSMVQLGTSIYESSGIRATATTELARKLAPPAGPSLSRNISCAGLLWLFVLWLVYTIVGEAWLNQFAPSVAGAAILLLCGIFIWLVLSLGYRQDLPAWKKKMAIYNRLYYCTRDDCVFDPATGAFVSAERMGDLLTSQIPQQAISTAPAPIVSSVTPLATKTPTGPPIVDLSGMWSAKGYDCPAGVQVPEEIVKIEQIGESVKAVKVIGDDCIRSGETTFVGAIDLTSIPGTFKVQVQASSGVNSAARQYMDALLEVVSNDRFYLVGQGFRIGFTRIE